MCLPEASSAQCGHIPITPVVNNLEEGSNAHACFFELTATYGVCKNIETVKVHVKVEEEIKIITFQILNWSIKLKLKKSFKL